MLLFSIMSAVPEHFLQTSREESGKRNVSPEGLRRVIFLFQGAIGERDSAFMVIEMGRGRDFLGIRGSLDK